jgi:hypothetical protein
VEYLFNKHKALHLNSRTTPKNTTENSSFILGKLYNELCDHMVTGFLRKCEAEIIRF